MADIDDVLTDVEQRVADLNQRTAALSQPRQTTPTEATGQHSHLGSDRLSVGVPELIPYGGWVVNGGTVDHPRTPGR